MANNESTEEFLKELDLTEEEIESYKKKEEEYNSKSFFYRLTHKF